MTWLLRGQYGENGIEELISLGTKYVMKIRQDRKMGLGLPHQNPGILSRLFTQAAESHQKKEEWQEEPCRKKESSSTKTGRETRNKNESGVGHFRKLSSPT